MNKQIATVPSHERSYLLLLSAALLGIIVVVLLYDKQMGVSYPLFCIAFYAFFFINMRQRIKISPNVDWLMLIPIFLLSLTYLFFSSPVFYLLNFVAIPVLVVMQTTLAAGRAGEKWTSVFFFKDILYGFLYRPFAYLLLPFRIAARVLTAKAGLSKNNIFLKISVGIIATIPLLVVIISLLASADEVFRDLINRIPSIFPNMSVEVWVPRLVFGTCAAALSFSYIWSLMKPKKEPLIDLRQNPKGVLDPVIAVTVLSMINALYLLFTCIQFSYLFSSFSFALPSNFTYAEYARRGFFELVVVTCINFTILLILIFFTKKSSPFLKRPLQILESMLVLCTGIMLISAFVRMYLYEQMYGFTYLRVLTHAFMIFLFILFLFTLGRVWKEDLKLYRLYFIFAVASFVAINYMNIDVLIARYNIDRYHSTGKIDTAYLSTLSDDAVPELIRLLGAKDKSVAAEIQNGLAGRKRALENADPWQSFNISRYRAKKALSGYDLQYDPNVENYNPYDEP